MGLAAKDENSAMVCALQYTAQVLTAQSYTFKHVLIDDIKPEELL